MFMLRFYGPVNPMVSCRVYLSTRLLGRLSPLVNQYWAHSFTRNWQLPFLNQGENDRRKYFTINLHERMLPTSAGVEPATSLSPVGRRIQMSHRGRLKSSVMYFCESEKNLPLKKIIYAGPFGQMWQYLRT